MLRQQRSARDRVKNSIQAQSPLQVANEVTNKGQNQAKAIVTPSGSPSVPAFEDTAKTDQVFETRTQAPMAQMQALPPKTDEENIVGATPGMPQDLEHSAGLAITIPPDSTANFPSEHAIADEKSTDILAAAPEGQLEAADPVDFDFESMFNDTELVNASDPANFQIDFSSDSVNPNIMSDSTFENINMSDVDMTNVAPTSNEDINSLLPGLENYVNAETDLSNLGVPPSSAIPQTVQELPVISTVELTSNAAQTAPMDPDLDHLFDGIDFDIPAGEGDDMGDSNLVDLDDFNWD